MPKIRNIILYSCKINFDFMCPFRQSPFYFSLLSLSCMGTIRTVKKLTEWETCSSRPVGRPRMRCLEQVEEDLKKMKVRNWRRKCKDGGFWNEIVKQAKTHQGLYRQLKKKKKVALFLLSIPCYSLHPSFCLISSH